MTGLFPDLATEVLQTCRARGLRIATAESCTGGLVCGALTAIPGSSDVVEAGFVVYSYATKSAVLGVPAKLLRQHGAVSEDVAKAMAEGAGAHADIAVAVTGVAGPGGSDSKPEGMVCFGIAARGQQTLTETIQFGPIGRGNVRRRSVERALRLLLQAATG